jgi:hypothetical protein
VQVVDVHGLGSADFASAKHSRARRAAGSHRRLTLTLAMYRMAQRRAIVKRKLAVPSAGRR